MHSLQERTVARLGFCVACPTETETSRREAGFHMVFLAYKPIYTDFTWLHNGGRSTVWYAYPKEERAVILRDLLLFKSPRRGLASVGVGVLGAPDPAPEAVTNYYVTRPPPPGRQPSSKPCNAAP